MTIRFDQYSHFVVLTGRKAQGKTTFTKYFLFHVPAYIVLDIRSQFKRGYIIHYAHRLIPAFNQWKRIIFQPVHFNVEEFDLFFGNCLKLTNYTLVIDEIDRFARGRWYISENLNELVNRGRLQGIGIIVNSRRPHLVHVDIRGNSDWVICFTFHKGAESELEYMAEWLGVSEEDIIALPPYHSYCHDCNKGNTFKQKPCRNL